MEDGSVRIRIRGGAPQTMRTACAVAVGLVIAACGGTGGTLASDFLAVTAVVEVPADQLVFTGRDISGDVIDPGSAQPRLEVFEARGAKARWLQGALPPSGEVVFSRDPLAAGASGPILDAATDVVAVLRPLITPTVGGVAFDSWFIALDGNGKVIAADWDGAQLDKLEALLATGDDPVETIGAAVEALAARELGEPIDPEAVPLLDILDS